MATIITNKAILNYNNTSAETCPVITFVEPTLGVGKRAFTDKDGIILDNGTVGKDRTIVYDILLVNYSSTKFTNLVIEDVIFLDDENYASTQGYVYDKENSSYENESSDINKIKIIVKELLPNSTAQVHYTLNFNSDVKIGTKINNQGQINYNENPADNPSKVQELNVLVDYTETEVSASKTGPDIILCGQTYSYVLEFENKGDQVATGVSVEDFLPENFQADLSKLQVVNGKNTLNVGEYVAEINEQRLIIKDVDGSNKLNIQPKEILQITITGTHQCK